jgi:hypothetical protein
MALSHKPARRVPVQLEFPFMHTMPPRLSPAAEVKRYAEYRRSVRDDHNPKHRQEAGHGTRQTARRA